MKKMGVLVMLVSGTLFAVGTVPTSQEAMKKTPAEGHDIHVTAPHVVDGVVMGPYHHYCKAVSPTVLECLIYDSTDPNALLVQVEYFVAKSVTRTTLTRDVWNKHYHDHALEIATGRVQVHDRPPEEAKAIAEAAAKTDGIIFHLWWPHGAAAPNGEVRFPQAISHKYLNENEWIGPASSKQ